MEYRVEELAAAAEVRVDTIRFYQARGLLPAPVRRKRLALYSEQHLSRLKQIRKYQSQGLSLAVIGRLFDAGAGSKKDALLRAVAEQSDERSMTRSQLAARTGIPEPLLASVELAGLLNPIQSGGEKRYGEADLQMARAAIDILTQGFPLGELLQLAMQHNQNVVNTVDAAIDLFNRHVRKAGGENNDVDRVAQAFRALLPASTTLVALHFQRTLLNRALDRLRDSGESESLEAAQAVVQSGRLEVTWR